MNTVNAASKSEIDLIHTLLENKFGQLYADIWKVGVNLSLRISDLLSLQYSQLNIQDRSLQLTESKTGKQKMIRLNSAAIAVIERRRQEHPSDCWLFQVHSHRAKDKPISRVSVSRVFKDAGDMVKLNINTHSVFSNPDMSLSEGGI